jgi:hypothetical protein
VAWERPKSQAAVTGCCCPGGWEAGCIPGCPLATHQKDQAVQEQRVEEADGAGHLVGENQTSLGSTQGWGGPKGSGGEGCWGGGTPCLCDTGGGSCAAGFLINGALCRPTPESMPMSQRMQGAGTDPLPPFIPSFLVFCHLSHAPSIFVYILFLRQGLANFSGPRTSFTYRIAGITDVNHDTWSTHSYSWQGLGGVLWSLGLFHVVLEASDGVL